MMTVKPTSLKKSDKTLSSIEEYGFSRVNSWTRNELLALQKSSKLPICMPLQDGSYFVATFKVEKISEVCWKVEKLEFTDKRSAIFYCALMHLGKILDAQDLYRVDLRVGQLDLDKALFRIRLDSAHNSQDQFKIGLFSSRYEESKGKLRFAKQELEEIIATAKYIIRNSTTGNSHETH